MIMEVRFFGAEGMYQEIQLSPLYELAEEELAEYLADPDFAWVERYELWEGEEPQSSPGVPLVRAGS